MVTIHYSPWNPCCKGNFSIKWLIPVFLLEASSKYNHPARQLGGKKDNNFKKLSRKSDSMSGFLWLKQSCRGNNQSNPTDKRSVAFLRIFKVGLIVTLVVAGRCLTTSSYGKKKPCFVAFAMSLVQKNPGRVISNYPSDIPE